MTLNKEVKPADGDWEDLYDEWVEEGRADEFEIMDSDGGRRYLVLDRDTDTPTFLLHAADGPTDYDTTDVDNDGGRKTKGYYLMHSRRDGFSFRRDARGKVTIHHFNPPHPLEED